MSAVSCDDTVFDPFSNDDQYFTVYGVLKELETRHEIRVIPITRSPVVIDSPSHPGAEIDAVVTSEEIEGGEIIATHRWAHTLAQLDDGNYGHVYTANFQIWPGRTYRLLITRLDGSVTSAETTVPRITNADLIEHPPLFISADSTVVSQEIITKPPISRPWNIRAIYIYEGGIVNNGRVYVDYGRSGEPTPEGGWRTEFYPLQDTSYIYEAARFELTTGRLEPGDLLFYRGMGIELEVFDAELDLPVSVTDPDFVVQPGSGSNVVNGDGVFGSVAFHRLEWNAAQHADLLGFN